MTNNIHLSDYYFDLNKRDTLSTDEKFIFSKFIKLTNELISKINNSNLDNSLKEKKFKEIKLKISQCHSLSLTLEYYLDFEFEIHKINSRIDEYSNLEFIDKNSNISQENKKTLTINTETKHVYKDEYSVNKDINNTINNPVINFESKKVKDIDFYINKYKTKNNVSTEYILDVLSNI